MPPAGSGSPVGLLAGVGLAGRSGLLSTHLGKSLQRRAALAGPAIVLGVIALGPIVADVPARVTDVSLCATVAVGLAAWALGTMARTRHVDRITPSTPVASVRWEVPSSGLVDVALVALLALMVLGNGSEGDWTTMVLWIGLLALWAESAVVEGRWHLGKWGREPEIRIYETGLVKGRPHARSFVPWSTVKHVRVRDGDIVLDRGLFEVRFEAGDLGDPGAVLTAIERTSATPVLR
ncbi:hypothetical protein [Halovivax cerinus]|uniref:DUF304 domain-containing protein n=1 Tax=Halovivax cerinus TaxID=1487865 RepID=A0ABD5NSQ7_9EURY|nr:hypothetical protein [Halovivax cerinus]